MSEAIKGKERFYNLDVLRFIGCIIIVIFHIFLCSLKSFQGESEFIHNMLNSTKMGGTWVDFFFILSGFLMFYATNFNSSFKEFFKKKCFRLLPTIIFALLIYKILSLFDLLEWRKYVNIFAFFLLNNVGLTSKFNMGNIHPAWFVSALFWAMMSLFYLKTLVTKKWFNFICAHLVIFSYVLIANTTSFAPVVVFNFLCIGYVRAIAGLATGYFISEWYKSIAKRSSDITLGVKLIYTLIEIYVLLFLIYNTLFHKISFLSHSLFVLAYIAIICLFLLNRGFLSQLLNKKSIGFLGHYTYSMYIMHIIILDLIKNNIWANNLQIFIAHPYINILCILLLTFLTGIFTYYVIEKAMYQFLTKKYIKVE